VSKDAPFTRRFLAGLEGKPWVDLHIGRKDREVVDLYDDFLQQTVISLEVTKPSEQAFKALMGTRTRGGVILLFAEPVGRQEVDNLFFLERHRLVPSTETNTRLWDLSADGRKMDSGLRTRLWKESRTWRGVRLPRGSKRSADFIWWMLTSGLFARMISNSKVVRVSDEESGLLGTNGVSDFWDLATSV
jgi:hypothetical protein